MPDKLDSGIVGGICVDCGKIIQIGEWPYRCRSKEDGHALLIRLAILPNGRTVEYAPPTPISPMKGPSITRDWMDAGGNLTPMKEGSWNKNHVGKDA